MVASRYRQFCPVAMAAEVLDKRWTLVLVRELLAGSTRFNDLRRGVPRMSPTLLSRRLRDLEEAGILERHSAPKSSTSEYRLTRAGKDLGPVVEAIGLWGQKWVDADPSLRNLDPGLLMWDMRRNLDPSPLPKQKTVVEFIYEDQPDERRLWWLVVEPDGEVDLCSIDPGFEVDLYVETSLRCMTAIWMGLTTVGREDRYDNLRLTGRRTVAKSMPRWLGLSPFAKQKKHAQPPTAT